MREKSNRVLALLLAVMMTLVLLPTSVFAAESTVSITAQPVAASVVKGNAGALTVTAVNTASTDMEYTWYSCAADKSGEVMVGLGGYADSFSPDTDTAGEFYYFCRVNVKGDATDFADSEVVKFTVTEPKITAEAIASTTVTIGNDAVLSASATIEGGWDEANITYEWFKCDDDKGTNPASMGVTEKVFTIPTEKAGTFYYFYKASSPETTDVASSKVATITVSYETVAVAISADQNVAVGKAPAAFKVTVTPEKQEYTYQWYSNTTKSTTGGTQISGATTASYAPDNGKALGSYYYYCAVTAASTGTVNSPVATLTVSEPVVAITGQPGGLSFKAGAANKLLAVVASANNGATLTYQWYTNTTASNEGGTAVSGANSAQYEIPTSTKVGDYFYFCEVGAAGAKAVRSSVATVKIATATLTIGNATASAATFEYATATAYIEITGAEADNGQKVTYQWYEKSTSGLPTKLEDVKDDTKLTWASATKAKLMLPATLSVGTHYFYCVLSAVGVTDVFSDACVTITVKAKSAALTIDSNSIVSGLKVGQITAEHKLVASLATPQDGVTYTWYQAIGATAAPKTDVKKGTGATFQIPTTLKAGTYNFYCVAEATGFEAISNPLTAVVVSVPTLTVTLVPADGKMTVAAGKITESLVVKAEGDTSYTYQWYTSQTATYDSTNAEAISSATAASYKLPTNLAKGTTYYYFCEVKGANAAAKNSNMFTVTVDADVIQITQQPESVTVYEGAISGNLTVAATATDGKGVTYQWEKYDTTTNTWVAISGETNPTLAIPTDLTAAAPGPKYSFHCKITAVTGTIGSLETDPAVITVEGITIKGIKPDPSLAPVITVTQGAITDNLYAEGVAAGGKVAITFNWYEAAIYNVSAPATDKKIATGAKFAIPTDSVVGSKYYYCELVAGSTKVCTGITEVKVVAATITVTGPVSSKLVTFGAITAADTLSVVATIDNGAELTYQWYMDGSAEKNKIAKATSATLALPTDLPAGEHTFNCVVTAKTGETATSNTCTVTVTGAKTTITTQPKDAEYIQGAVDGKLTVAATSAVEGEMTYLWQQSTDKGANWTDVANTVVGYNKATLTLPTTLTGADAKDGTDYVYRCKVMVKNAADAYSDPATITVYKATITFEQPADLTTKTVGDSLTLSVKASINNKGTLTYELKKYTDETCATEETYTATGTMPYTVTSPGTTGNSEYYKIVISNSDAATVTTDVIKVSTFANAITITKQPESAAYDYTKVNGSLMAVGNAGTEVVKYDWYEVGATTDTKVGTDSIRYTLPEDLTIGEHSYYCVLSAGATAASVKTKVAVITVNEPTITITTQPADPAEMLVTKIEGELKVAATTNITLDDTNKMTYAWYACDKNGAAIGASLSDKDTLDLTTVTALSAAGDHYFYGEVAVGAGTATAKAKTRIVKVVTSGVTVKFTTEPVSTNFQVGKISGYLTVEATCNDGEAVLYQWYQSTDKDATTTSDNTLLIGKSSKMFGIPTSLDTGTYYYFCVAYAGSDTSKQIASEVAKVGVNKELITITTQPEGMELMTGYKGKKLTVVAANSNPREALNYQWYKDGIIIAGATSATYSITDGSLAAQRDDSYKFYCLINSANASEVKTDVVDVYVFDSTISIITQPKDATFKVDEIDGSLNVEAMVTGKATAVIYEWYQCDDPEKADPTVDTVVGTDSAIFMIPDTLTAGEYYYYCLVYSKVNSGIGCAKTVQSAVAKVTVTDDSGVKVTSITFNRTALSVPQGISRRGMDVLAPVVLPENATNKELVWSSSDPMIVAVNENGAIYAKGKGGQKATVRATAKDGSGIYAECEVTIIEGVKSLTLQMNGKDAPGYIVMKVGDKLTFGAKVLDATAKIKTVNWMWSGNDAAFTIDKDAKTLKAVAPGRYLIKIWTQDGTAKVDWISVIVK